MPTANANTGNGFSKAISYALQEAKKYSEETRAKVLELNQVYGSSKEMGKQMREVADDRKTALKPVLHVQINFHPDEKLTRAQAEQAINSILKDIGIEKDNHQYVVVQHKDKAHDHYHVVANRVGMDGELLNDHRIKDRLQVACDKVEKEQHLRPTQGRTVVYDPSLKKGYRYMNEREQQKEKKPGRDKNPRIMDTKNDIQKELSAVLSRVEIQTPDQLQHELAKRGIEMKLTENKKGISGASFRKDNIAVKGTAAGYKWSDISKVLSENKDKAERPQNATLNRPKSSLPIQMGEQKNKSPFVKDNPKAGDLNIPKFETHSMGSKPAHKGIQKEGLQPTVEEQKEVDFAKEYNPRAQSAISEIKGELQKGNAAPDVIAIMEKYGFKADKDRFMYSNGQMQAGIPINAFDRTINEIKNQQNNFREDENKYNALMKKEPEKINLLDKMTGKAKEKEVANKNLAKEKKQTVKPEFKPRIYGLQERDFEIRPQFEQRQFEHKRQQEFKESIIQTNDQNRNRGLSR